MQLLDNINSLFGEDLKKALKPHSRLMIVVASFSIYAYEALKHELENVDSLEFIFTQPTFIPDEASDSGKRVRREFHIPKIGRERDFYGTEFEIQLRNKMTQREFLEDLDQDLLPNDRTGYQDTLVWQKLYNFQRDAANGIINKLETYNGCILADSVGLGKTFTALAVIKYYELRNKSVLVLCPKKLADNWLTYNHNLKTNVFASDRFSYDVLCHTDLQRTSGESFGTPMDRINWGNYDLVVIDESHNFRNNDAFKDRETRYQKLMNSVIREGVKTKVLMLSATPVNNRFNDLRNQLALAYEGNSGELNAKLRTDKDIEEVFRRAQAAFNAWSKLPPQERTAEAFIVVRAAS